MLKRGKYRKELKQKRFESVMKQIENPKIPVRVRAMAKERQVERRLNLAHAVER